MSGNATAPVKKHPCLVQYGSCQYGRQCKMADFPGDTCLNYLRGRCTFKQQCMYRHDVARGGCVQAVEKVVEGVGQVKMVGKSAKLGVVERDYQEKVPERPLIQEKTAPRNNVQISINYDAQHTDDLVTMRAVSHEEAQAQAYEMAMEQEYGAWEEQEEKELVLDSVQDFPTLGSKKRTGYTNAAKGLVVTTQIPQNDPAPSCPPGTMNPNALPWQPSPWTGMARAPAQTGTAPAWVAPAQPKPKAKPSLHPCVTQFGSCKYGANCQYAKLAGNTCLMFLQGQCKFSTACKNKHSRT
eukprot:TRINITY_DN13898_c0_g3_i1.p1 TRINITY_DN13898_c0_g3~~TRINITY_DN13898_c0_g3_i1.p1  ORF type:complete len:314 (+),score=74.35 TRINITY_DN13898_c0_g3_i1:53-943(+)